MPLVDKLPKIPVKQDAENASPSVEVKVDDPYEIKKTVDEVHVSLDAALSTKPVDILWARSGVLGGLSRLFNHNALTMLEESEVDQFTKELLKISSEAKLVKYEDVTDPDPWKHVEKDVDQVLEYFKLTDESQKVLENFNRKLLRKAIAELMGDGNTLQDDFVSCIRRDELVKKLGGDDKDKAEFIKAISLVLVTSVHVNLLMGPIYFRLKMQAMSDQKDASEFKDPTRTPQAIVFLHANKDLGVNQEFLRKTIDSLTHERQVIAYVQYYIREKKHDPDIVRALQELLKDLPGIKSKSWMRKFDPTKDSNHLMRVCGINFPAVAELIHDNLKTGVYQDYQQFRNAYKVLIKMNKWDLAWDVLQTHTIPNAISRVAATTPLEEKMKLVIDAKDQNKGEYLFTVFEYYKKMPRESVTQHKTSAEIGFNRGSLG
jgi:hypothetical protein